MRTKFVIFGHEIRIRPESEIRMHVTQFPETKDDEVEVWKHDFPMDKRVNVYTQYKGFIDYIFRDYDVALMMYKDTAILHLEAILSSLCDIRTKFESKGATSEQLELFDNKIFSAFESSIDIVKNRVETLKRVKHPSLQDELKLVKKLETFKIEDYYKRKYNVKVNKPTLY
jgi:hypothetical protein